MAFSVKVSVTVPKKLLSDIRFREAVEEKMERKTLHDVEEEFYAITNSWADDPELDSEVVSNRNGIFARVSVYGNSMGSRIFKMVSLGTPPHDIDAKKPYMVFRWGGSPGSGYIPSTSPGSLMTRRSKRIGGTWLAKRVNHPGMKARKFDELIAKKYTHTFQADIQEAIDDAARNGWG